MERKNLTNPNTAAQSIPVTINGDALSDGGIQYLTSLTADPAQSSVAGLGNHFTMSVSPRSMVVLLIAPRLPGDFNNDGVVDAADYTVWRDTQGQIGQDLAADFTGSGGAPDGIVDDLDYQFWVAHFGATAGSGAGATSVIPEPSSLVVLGIGSLALPAPRLHRRRAAVRS
jgi:hypothetical protein